MPLARAFCTVPVAAILATAACGGSQADQQAKGVRVVLQSDAAFTQAPDFQARLDNTIDVALAYFGGTRADIDGRSITFVDAPGVDCGGRQALGCFDGNIRLTTRDPGIGTFACVEQTILVHEIGHAVLGDPDHTDPRWMEMDAVASELNGRTGYVDGGAAPCVTYVSVWRHPLDSP
jgi:hypothetical protein